MQYIRYFESQNAYNDVSNNLPELTIALYDDNNDNNVIVYKDDNKYVSQSVDDGIGAELIAEIQRLKKQGIITNLAITEEDGMFIVDGNGNIGMSYLQSGLDAACLSEHLKTLIEEGSTSKKELEDFKPLVSDNLLSIYHQRNVKLVLPSNAKILLYGDSISSTDYTWYKDWMSYYTNLSDVYNGGFSGFTAAQIARNDAMSRIFNYNPDVIILLTGGNDIGDKVGTFGAIPDEDNVSETDISIDYNGTYFIQAVSHMIRKITSYYYDVVARANLDGSETAQEKIDKIANVKLPYLAVLTPLPQKRSGGALTWSFEPNWIRKRNAVVECCNKYNIHCIDTYCLWGVDMSKEPEWSSPTDKINQNGIYTMDGLHPSKVGYKKIVQLINGQIDIVVKD